MNLFEGGSLRDFGGVAENFCVGGTVVEAVAFEVDQSNHVGGVFGDDPKEFLAVPELSAITKQAPLLVARWRAARAGRSSSIAWWRRPKAGALSQEEYRHGSRR